MRKVSSLMLIAAVIAMTFTAANAGVGPPVPDAIWADGMLYRTVPTPANLPDRGPKDGIYAFTDLQGQRSVAEAKPGDRDYNGGRWQVYLVHAVNPGNIDHELTSWEEVEMYINSGDLEVTGMGPTFVCPLIP